MPRVLRPGDTIAVVAPSGPVRPELLDAGVAAIEELGFAVRVLPGARERDRFLAGLDTVRLADLHAAWADPEVAALWCARGGYGAQRLVDVLDWDLVRAHPKPLVGYSDVTALHLALWARTGQTSIHGPTVEATPGRLTPASWAAVRTLLTTPPAAPGATLLGGGRTLVAGTAAGPLVGGNLSLVCATVGTADARALDGAVLLLEDVGEPGYRLDRMLLQLRRAGVLARCAGIVAGGFTGCGDDHGTDPDALVAEHAAAAGLPAVTGWELGHGPGQLAVRHGAPVLLDATAGLLLAGPT